MSVNWQNLINALVNDGELAQAQALSLDGVSLAGSNGDTDRLNEDEKPPLFAILRSRGFVNGNLRLFGKRFLVESEDDHTAVRGQLYGHSDKTACLVRKLETCYLIACWDNPGDDTQVNNAMKEAAEKIAQAGKEAAETGADLPPTLMSGTWPGMSLYRGERARTLIDSPPHLRILVLIQSLIGDGMANRAQALSLKGTSWAGSNGDADRLSKDETDAVIAAFANEDTNDFDLFGKRYHISDTFVNRTQMRGNVVGDGVEGGCLLWQLKTCYIVACWDGPGDASNIYDQIITFSWEV